jgi:hypothetical protein
LGWIDGILEKSEHIYQLTILKVMLFFPLLGIFLPFFIFFLIFLLLEINVTKGLKSLITSMHRMIYKHLPGILILLIYYLYDFAWAEYHAGHYPIAMVKEFRFFPSLDRHSNFIATLAIFYFIYSGLFLVLNKFVLNKEL